MIGGWNYIVGKSCGKYLKFLASDDLLEPTCVAELVTAALAHPAAALITCQRQFIDDVGRPARRGGVIKKMRFSNKNMVVGGKEHAHWILTTLRENKIGEPTAVLYPAKLVKKVGVYDPQFSQFADFEYWIRLLQFGDLVYVHQPLCSFRTHALSNTSTSIGDGRFITEIFTLLNKYHHLLSPAQRSHVTHQKTLDTLKNIKDLIYQGNFLRASRYTIKLLGAIIQSHR